MTSEVGNPALRERIANASLILTALLAFLTLSVFYNQLNEMKKAYGPIKDQATFTQKSLQLSERTAARQLRAYVLFDSALVEKQGSNEYNVSVQVKNSGQTPAYNVTFSWRVEVLEYPLKLETIEGGSPDPNQSADMGAAIQISLGDPRSITISNDDLAAIKERRKAIYIFAAIAYKDTFQRRQSAKFVAVNLPNQANTAWKMRGYFSDVSDDYPQL